MTTQTKRAALWVRVSTADQVVETQTQLLTDWAERRGLEVVQIYTVEKSAWRGDHHPMLKQLYQDANHRQFDVLMVQALDRLGREGPGATLQVWQTLLKYGVAVASYREPFVEAAATVAGGAGESLAELLVMISGWIARQESELISQRTKAGNRRRQKTGLPLGRQPGAKDRRPRSNNGYQGNRNAARKCNRRRETVPVRRPM